MKVIFVCLILSFILLSCNKDSSPVDPVNSKITAKEKVNDILVKARNEYSGDSKLAIIYGRNIQTNGEIDLLKPVESQFIYGVQSNQKSGNEFYIPVFGTEPIRSPLNFTDILRTIKDTTAKKIVSGVIQQLSKASIDDNVNWIDSPALVNIALINGGSVFSGLNSNTKIDILLTPGISVDQTYMNIKAVWIINFYNETNSLVLLIDAVSGKFITKISQ